MCFQYIFKHRKMNNLEIYIIKIKNMFPNEIMVIIFLYLDIKTLSVFSQTCKKYYNIYTYHMYNLKIKDHVSIINKKEMIIILENIYKKLLFTPQIIDIRIYEILIKKIYNENNYITFYFNKHLMNLSLCLENIIYIIKYNKINIIKINDLNRIIVFFNEYFKNSIDNYNKLFNNNLFKLEKSKNQKEDIKRFFLDW